jgi:hypothetical protein
MTCATFLQEFALALNAGVATEGPHSTPPCAWIGEGAVAAYLMLHALGCCLTCCHCQCGTLPQLWHQHDLLHMQQHIMISDGEVPGDF